MKRLIYNFNIFYTFLRVINNIYYNTNIEKTKAKRNSKRYKLKNFKL